MIRSQTIQIGGVYQTEWSEKPVRVLLCDEFEVFYESRNHLNNWNLTQSLKRKVIFYRIPIELFAE